MSKKLEKELNNSKNPLEDLTNSSSTEPKETKQKAKEEESKEKINESKLEKDKQVSQLEENINNLKKEVEFLKEKNLRLLADLDNQRKELQKEIEREEKMMKERIKYGNQKLLEQLLFFPHDYEEAMKYGQNESDPKLQKFLLGFQMILVEFQNVLKRYGVTEIKVTPLTDVYDDKLHGDILEVEVIEENDKYPTGTILEIFKKGYRIQDRILRPATVKISKKKK